MWIGLVEHLWSFGWNKLERFRIVLDRNTSILLKNVRCEYNKNPPSRGEGKLWPGGYCFRILLSGRARNSDVQEQHRITKPYVWSGAPICAGSAPMGMVDRLPWFSNFNRNSNETAMSRWKTVSPQSLFTRVGRPFEKGIISQVFNWG